MTMQSVGFLHPAGLAPEKTTHAVTGAEDGSLVVWDVTVGLASKGGEGGVCNLIRIVPAHAADGYPSAAVNAICSHDMGIVTGGDDGRVILWSHQLQRLFEFNLRKQHIDAFDAVRPEIVSLSMHGLRRELLV